MNMQAIKTPKKLIEVALPLDDINLACAREKSIRHGHPSTLHLWWARRPLAAARAVIFAQMVNDPGYERNLGRGVNKEKAKIERERLFDIIRRLVQWENTNNESLLTEAREEIRKSWRETCELNRNHPQAAELFNPDKLPAFHDPFAGGGALPLEAQRLGLESYASDLNPVAVLINKAMIEIPPRFAGYPPVGPIPSEEKQSKMVQDWSGAKGLAEDVRRYGAWIREEAIKRIGHLYPQIDLPSAHGGGKATVIAWLWARTVKSPNPAFSHVDIPLTSSFVLSAKEGNGRYLHPVIEGDSYCFEVRTGMPPSSALSGTKVSGKGSGFICLLSGSPVDGKYIKAEAQKGRMGARLMAIVVEGKRDRIYLAPTDEMISVAHSAKPEWKPTQELVGKARDQMPLYGMTTFGDLFTPRQLVALTTLSDLVIEAQSKIFQDAVQAKLADDGLGFEEGGRGAKAYAQAVSVYLAFCVDKNTLTNTTLATWQKSPDRLTQAYARQAIAMTWDYAEANPLSDAGGGFGITADAVAKVLLRFSVAQTGHVYQQDAATNTRENCVVSTDPPYYDNIAYADLSDYFYAWLRRTMKPTFPSYFATMAVPKAEELVATPYRHSSKEAAELFFLNGMTRAMERLANRANKAFPTTIYYAFKQSDTNDLGTGNTGWETFLEAVIVAGFSITGTWPMRTELTGNLKKSVNALASSIVLVCRPRAPNTAPISRRDFLRELKDELSEAVDVMIGGAEGVSPVAPVDLAQAVIGPGMAIFSKYSAVLEADGSPMTVHTALTLINRMLIEGGDEFDGDTQFCLGWFDEQGWAAGEFGKADVLARAKGTSVEGVQDAGVVEAGSGKVRLLKPAEYPADWSPKEDNRTPVWEALHQMIRMLQTQGESAAGALLAQMPERAEPIRSLAYRLYTLCERKGWAEEARGYNELITSWLGIEAASHDAGHLGSQAKLDI